MLYRLIRVLSSLVLISVSLGAVLLGFWWLWTLVLVSALILLGEWMVIWNRRANLPVWALKRLGLMIVAWGLLVVVMISVPTLGWRMSLLLIGLGASGLGGLAWMNGRSWLDCGWLITGFTYIALGLLAVLWLNDLPRQEGMVLLLYLLSIVAATDSAALVVGRTIKGVRLVPLISPRKTWSGLIGGLMAGTLAGVLAATLLVQTEQLWRVAGVAFGLAVISQVGDLLASAFKRHYDVKDSSQLIPGHGGLLDRADSLLAAALSLALFYQLVGSPLS